MRSLKHACIRALEQGTTVNALVRDFLERFADADRQGEILRGLVELAERVSGGPTGGPGPGSAPSCTTAGVAECERSSIPPSWCTPSTGESPASRRAPASF
ncbi:MAG: hypothetical protein M3252_05165 [Actinomycetota bacterium]|nr:hypothetical protein [Actinomycetota bacterium]